VIIHIKEKAASRPYEPDAAIFVCENPFG